MAAKEIRPAPVGPIKPAEHPDEGYRHECRQEGIEVTTFECEPVEPAAKPFGGQVHPADARTLQPCADRVFQMAIILKQRRRTNKLMGSQACVTQEMCESHI